MKTELGTFFHTGTASHRRIAPACLICAILHSVILCPLVDVDRLAGLTPKVHLLIHLHHLVDGEDDLDVVRRGFIIRGRSIIPTILLAYYHLHLHQVVLQVLVQAELDLILVDLVHQADLLLLLLRVVVPD